MTRRVVLLKLSGQSPDEAVRSADDLVRDRSVPDLSCLLIVDDAVTLGGHGAALEHLMTSGRVPHFICLATGRPEQPGLVQVPGNVSTWEDSAVLWVGDQLGVDWVPGTSAVALLRPANGSDGLQRLIEILSSVQVYDKVRELAAEVPNGVACPGLRLAESEADVASFPAVLAEAIERLEPRIGAAQGHEQPFGQLRAARSGGSALSEDGDLARVRQECVTAAEAADRALADLAGPAGLLGLGQSPRDARDGVVVAGEALTDLRTMVEVLLAAMPMHGGLSDVQLERFAGRLRRAGVSTGPRSAVGGAAAAAPLPGEGAVPSSVAVSKAVAASLREGQTLSGVTEQLAATERLLRPPVGVPYRTRLDQRCPLALVDELRAPAPFPRAWPWLPLFGAIAAALASAEGIAAGIAAAVLWTGLAAVAAHRAGAASGAQRERVGASLLPDLFAALAGVAVGSALAIVLKPTAPVSVACVIMALVTVVTVAVASWRTRVGRWRRALSPCQAADAARALTDLVEGVAGVLASTDSARLDAVARARIIVEAIRDRLREYADGYRHEAVSGDHARLGSVLLPALRELAVGVVFTQLAERTSDGETVREGALAKTAELIDVWAEHAREDGLFAPPVETWAKHMRERWSLEAPVLGTIDAGAAPVMRAWQDSVKAAVGGDPRGLMWQLCLPSDIAMLDAGGPMPALPFAPHLTRAALAGAAPPGTEWTADGQCAGLLRLVPIRLAAVSATLFTDDEQEPPG
jgi:hypothetical protein